MNKNLVHQVGNQTKEKELKELKTLSENRDTISAITTTRTRCDLSIASIIKKPL